MFGRRVPPHVVFALSLVLALLCGVAAYRYLRAENWLPGLLWAAAAVWFAVDAVRAHRWREKP